MKRVSIRPRLKPFGELFTTADRVQLYNHSFGQRYPGSILTVTSSGFICGVWFLGNNYRGSGYYGSHPPQYLPRITTLFPECTPVLHLFSGSLPSGNYTRIDVSANNKPDIVADAHHLTDVFTKSTKFRIIYADPPYSREAAARYGTPMINRRIVVDQCWKMLEPAGFLVWLDTVWPIATKKHMPLIGAIPIIRSQNHVVRCVFIMQKRGR